MKEINKQLYLQALNKWGKSAQMLQAAEECAELAKELIKTVNRGEGNNVIEEIADVEIMIEQLKIIFNENLIRKFKHRKLRLLEEKLWEDEDN